MESVDIKRVQARLLEIGITISRILENHNIPYMLTGGTLLGAIRHGGFIPWDDDFDLYLFDDTYDEAVDFLRAELPTDMFLEDEKTEPLFYHGWARVKDLYSEAVYRKVEESPYELYTYQGLKVDMFRCKKIHSSELLSYRLDEMRKYLKRLLDKNLITEDVFHQKNVFLTNKIETEEKNKPLEDCFVFGMPTTYRCQLEADVLPLKKTSFCGIDFLVPNNPEKILSQFYGDYMQLPEVKDRVGHYSMVKFL